MVKTPKNILGQELKALRKARGISGVELADLLGYSQSGISKIENGKLRPSAEFVAKFSQLLKLNKVERDNLFELTEHFLVEFRKWQQSDSNWPFLQTVQSEVMRREQRAAEIREFQWQVIPGLLQAEEYAESLWSMFQDGPPVKAAVALRLKRQKILQQKNKKFTFIISENALRNRICNSKAFARQCRKLMEVEQLGNVTLKILPSESRLPVLPPTSFIIYDQRMVFVETLSRELALWSEDEIRSYLDFFRKIEESSLAGTELRNILRKFQ